MNVWSLTQRNVSLSDQYKIIYCLSISGSPDEFSIIQNIKPVSVGLSPTWRFDDVILSFYDFKLVFHTLTNTGFK